MAIFPIDARGLMGDPPGGAASSASSRGNGVYTGSQYNSQRAGINNSQETLVSLASDTGGKAFLDSNDLSLGIVQAQQEFRSYYILGYYTTNPALDGKYRKITVKLNGNITASVEARPGYYADKVWGKFTSADKEMKLQEALTAADPVTEIPLALEIDYFRISPTAYFVPISVKVPGSLIGLKDWKSGGETEFDFIGNVLNERKAQVGYVRDNIKVHLDAASKETLANRSFHYDAGFTLAPGRYRLRFLVRENQSGKMGTFDTRFVVPDLAADSMTLKTSSVIWSGQKDALKAAVGAAEKSNQKTVDADPLILGNEKIVPSITRVFRRSQNMYIAFDVYDAAPDPAVPANRRVAVTMSLFNQKGLKTFESAPGDGHRASLHAPQRHAGAASGSAQDHSARQLRLPAQRGGRSRPQVRIPEGKPGDSVDGRRIRENAGTDDSVPRRAPSPGKAPYLPCAARTLPVVPDGFAPVSDMRP